MDAGSSGTASATFTNGSRVFRRQAHAEHQRAGRLDRQRHDADHFRQRRRGFLGHR